MSKTCKTDGKPCPAAVEGKGRGESRCEQNGICQRTNFSAAPILMFEPTLNALPASAAIYETDPDLPITPQGAQEVIEGALACLGDARSRGIADGLCAAFYMAHIITESEWHAYMNRIPAEVTT